MNLTILILNIIGTFFLSVEAIKIENLKKLTSLLHKSNLHLNPKINWVDENTQFGFKEKYGCYLFMLTVIIVFSPISFILLKSLLSVQNIYLEIFLTVFGALVIWTFIIYLFELIIKFLLSIEKFTAKGFIGIIGFIILVSSFTLQYLFTAHNNI